MQIQYRKLSDNEISYMKFRNINGNFFQILFECEKNGINVIEINKALKKLFNISKYLNLFIHNKEFVFDKRQIEVKCIEDTLNFNGYNFNTMDIFVMPLIDDLMDVYMFRGTKNDYLLFRFNHSYVDGQGALCIIKALISILNNKSVNYEISFESDYEYAMKKGIIKFSENLWYRNKINDLKVKSKDKGMYFKRIQINANVNAILSKVISIINSFYENDKLTYLIPTNIRNKEEQLINISNLTLPLYLNLDKSDSWNDIYMKMYQGVKDKRNLNLLNIKHAFVNKVNYSVFNRLIKVSKAIQIRKKRFFTAGCITNLGIIDKKNYECDKIKWKSVIDIPFYQPLFPFAIAIVENVDGIEIALVSDKEIINEQKANEILAKIKNEVEYI